jgi:hypothetical protein
MVTRACSLCQGSGWTTKQEHPEIAPVVELVNTTMPAQVVTPADNGPVDPRVAALQAEGFIVVSPIVAAPASS